MNAPVWSDLIGGILALGALLVLAYVAVVLGSEQAQGALTAVLSAATGYYLRGKIEKPGP